VHPDWAPLGAARMKELVDQDFFSGIRFFRVIQNFMAQFGISGSRPPSFFSEHIKKNIF
jgi:peptidyl-prolyl cis-trans isomerase A (cyclophilin A)